MRDEIVQREDANALLDIVCAQLALKTDVALSRALAVAPPVVSKIRHGAMTVGPKLLIRMHEATGLSIRHLKRYLEPHAANREDVNLYTIGEVELAINYWRKREPAVNYELAAPTSSLAEIYGVMIYEHRDSIEKSALSAFQADAMRIAITARK